MKASERPIMRDFVCRKPHWHAEPKSRATREVSYCQIEQQRLRHMWQSENHSLTGQNCHRFHRRLEYESASWEVDGLVAASGVDKVG
jgi:hypothetical protein